MPPFEALSAISSDNVATSSGYHSSGVHSHSRRTSHLKPEDAIYDRSRKSSPLGRSDTITANNVNGDGTRRRRDRTRGRDGERRINRTWKKLLWVKQAYPDNYTDEETFLDHLQRNPRLRPYEFWPLVADSTIIVQHICSVIIFVCCFTGIFQGSVSPVSVVSWATIGTVFGWVLRDYWVTQDEAAQAAQAAEDFKEESNTENEFKTQGDSLGIMIENESMSRPLSRVPSAVMIGSHSAPHSRNSSLDHYARRVSMPSMKEEFSQPASADSHPTGASRFATYSHYPPYEGRTSRLSPRNQERLATAKSAILIYCALLGISPILKSLTKSTSPDSIWAISSWLIIINVFTFDYGAGVEAKFPASLSTNAALMASTVLASRLPSTTHVFSLTLFSIEVFGLFPVFRRHLRHVSWAGHFILTGLIVAGAGGGLCVTITGGGWKAAVLGVILGGILTCLAMGMTSWWLIGLQRYKNEIRGPWDPARPILRRHWD